VKQSSLLSRPFLWLRGSFQFLGPLLNALLLLASLHIFFHCFFPGLASLWLGGEGEVFSTIPLFIGFLYSATIAIVMAAFVIANAERRRAFMRPILALLTGDPTHPAGLPLFRVVVLGALPFVLVAAFPRINSPATLEQTELPSLPTNARDGAWKSVAVKRLELFREHSRLSPVTGAYVRVAKQGNNCAVLVQYAASSVEERALKDERCTLWWLRDEAQKPLPELPSSHFQGLGHALERWQTEAGVAAIHSSTVTFEGGRLSAFSTVPMSACVLQDGVLSYQFSGRWRAEAEGPIFLAMSLLLGQERLFLRSSWSRCVMKPAPESAKSHWWFVFLIFLGELFFMTLASSGGTEI
jgi:hypothetical protein